MSHNLRIKEYSYCVGPGQLQFQIKIFEDIKLGAGWIFMLGYLVEESRCFVHSALTDVHMFLLSIVWSSSAIIL